MKSSRRSNKDTKEPILFVSIEGHDHLKTLRISEAPKPAGGPAPVRLTACLPSEECGCPEEVWVIDGVTAVIHFEEDRSSDILLFGGDWEDQFRADCPSMAHLRAELFRVMSEIPVER